MRVNGTVKVDQDKAVYCGECNVAVATHDEGKRTVKRKLAKHKCK